VDTIVITGVPPWDGRYPFDIADNEPTTREWGWIKRFSGYLPTTIEDGLKGADPELICAFAVIALRRAGKAGNDDVPGVYERLADAPFGAAVQLETDASEEEGDVGPPAGSSDGSSSSSGTDSTRSSETSPESPPISGIPGSAGSELPLAVSVISPRRS
jgi:hypothetical protein